MAAPLLNPYLDLWKVLRQRLDDEALLEARKKLIWAYSWAIPTSEAIHEIVSHGPVLELGAGTGYWAWLCAQAGADIAACDRNAAAPPKWFDVKSGSAATVTGFAGRNLLLCWPPLDEPMAFESLQAFHGETLFYVGEMAGRTGSSEFHAKLESDFRLVRRIEIPCWPGFQDSLFVFSRL